MDMTTVQCTHTRNRYPEAAGTRQHYCLAQNFKILCLVFVQILCLNASLAII